MRSTRKTVSLAKAFTLRGVGEELPPGTYEIVTDEEEIPALLFTAWRRVQTQLRIPSLELFKGLEQYVVIDPHELDDALMTDGA